jgi:hypothetical protein
LFCQYLSRLQKQHQDLFSSKEDITHYGISRSLRKSAVTRVGKAGLSNSEIGLVNRWRSVEQAKGYCPKHNMQMHYTDARALAPMTWSYCYRQNASSHLEHWGLGQQPKDANTWRIPGEYLANTWQIPGKDMVGICQGVRLIMFGFWVEAD